MGIRSDAYQLIMEFDRLAEKLSRDQRVRQAFVDLRLAAGRACMCDDARNLMRSRVVRAAVLAVNEYAPPTMKLDVSPSDTHELRQKYTTAEASVWADDPHRVESIRFVQAFLGNPNFRWLDSEPWYATQRLQVEDDVRVAR